MILVEKKLTVRDFLDRNEKNFFNKPEPNFLRKNELIKFFNPDDEVQHRFLGKMNGHKKLLEPCARWKNGGGYVALDELEIDREIPLREIEIRGNASGLRIPHGARNIRI